MKQQPGTLRDSFLHALLYYRELGGVAQLAAAPQRCCPGRIKDGVAGCTCWFPVYDLPQAAPDDLTIARIALGEQDPEVRPGGMCGDCAYRPGSPEKTNSEDAAYDADTLEHIAATGQRFWCHDGMRVPIAWRHPAGMQIPADPARTGDYKPPIHLAIPYRADGQPGLICAGWNARHRALTHPRQEP